MNRRPNLRDYDRSSIIVHKREPQKAHETLFGLVGYLLGRDSKASPMSRVIGLAFLCYLVMLALHFIWWIVLAFALFRLYKAAPTIQEHWHRHKLAQIYKDDEEPF